MKKQRILWSLLVVAFIALMGFNELAFAGKFVPPAWSQILPAKQRFQLVMNDEAVLDKETGLVWERSPSTTTMSWFDAILSCYNKTVGGRGGWRLPTAEELRSLVDPTQAIPALLAGHPFQNVQSNWYWSATTNAGDATNAWGVDFYSGFLNNSDKSYETYVWCVRGGHGYDAY